MTLNSMTGFARSDGQYQTTTWHWECRSLNSRGLDLRIRLPQGFEFLEQGIRELCGKTLNRGNCNIHLNIKRHETGSHIRVNEEALNAALAAMADVQKTVETQLPSVEGILALKGVLEVYEPEDSDKERKALSTALMDDFAKVLSQLSQMRAEEGQRLRQVLEKHIAHIETLVTKADEAPGRTPEAIRLKLQEHIKRILEGDMSSALAEDKLHQEAVLLAAKADIEEEIERLRSHITAAKDLLDASKPVGRQLDFLTQEFNREANTLCSKANDNDISRIGLELKAVVDQMREQVQNIE